jgi:hypothetical protein
MMTWRLFAIYTTIALASAAVLVSGAAQGYLPELFTLAGLSAFLYLLTRYLEARNRWRRHLISPARESTKVDRPVRPRGRDR